MACFKAEQLFKVRSIIEHKGKDAQKWKDDDTQVVVSFLKLAGDAERHSHCRGILDRYDKTKMRLNDKSLFGSESTEAKKQELTLFMVFSKGKSVTFFLDLDRYDLNSNKLYLSTYMI